MIKCLSFDTAMLCSTFSKLPGQMFNLEYNDAMCQPIPNYQIKSLSLIKTMCLNHYYFIKRVILVKIMLCLNPSQTTWSNVPDQMSKLDCSVMSQPVPNYLIKCPSLIAMSCRNPFQTTWSNVQAWLQCHVSTRPKLPDQTSKLDCRVMSQPVPNYLIKWQSLIAVSCHNPSQTTWSNI